MNAMSIHHLTFVSLVTAVGASCVLLPSAAQSEEDRNYEIHGFISQGYAKSTPGSGFPVGNSGESGGSFNFNDMALNVVNQVSPNLRVGIQLFAQDRGVYGHDHIQVDWAFGDYRVADWLGIRAGKIKIPNGLYNTSRDNDALRTAIFLPQGIYSDLYRDLSSAMLGAGLYGSTTGSLGTLRYEMYAGTLPFTTDSALAEAFGSVSAHAGPSQSAGLTWEPPLPGLRASLTTVRTSAYGVWTFGQNMPQAPWSLKKFRMNVASLEYAPNRMTLAAEYALISFDLSLGPYLPTTIWPGRSWYLSAAYRTNDWLEIGAYYNGYCSDRHACDGSTHLEHGVPSKSGMYQNDAALTVRLDITPGFVFKLEEHYIRGYTLNYLLPTASSAPNWKMFAAKATYAF